MIDDKIDYNEKFGENERTALRVFERVAPQGRRTQSQLLYDFLKYGWSPSECSERERETSSDRRCWTVTSRDARATVGIQCRVTNPEAYDKEMKLARKRRHSLRDRGTGVSLLPSEPPQAYNTTWRVAEEFVTDKTFHRTIQSMRGVHFDEPQIQPKFPIPKSVIRFLLYFFFPQEADGHREDSLLAPS